MPSAVAAVDRDRLAAGGGERDGEAWRSPFPALPSVTVTSLMRQGRRVSSSVIVPTPWPSAIVRVDRTGEVDEERLVELVERVA